MKSTFKLALGLFALVGCVAPGEPGGGGLSSPPPPTLHADLVSRFRQSRIDLASGQDLHASVKVINQGGAASQRVTGRWHLRGGSDLQVSETVTIPALKPAGVASFSFEHAFAPAQAGQYLLTFKADDTGRGTESDAANNASTVLVVVSPPELPPPEAQLSVTASTEALSFEVSQFIVAEVTVTNHGTNAVPVDGLWELEGAGVYLAVPVNIAALSPNESTTLLFQEPPDATRRGRFTLTFSALPGSPYVDKDAADNASAFDVVVVPFPNLKAEIVSVSALAVTSSALVALEVRWSNTGLSPLLFPAGVSEPAQIHLVGAGESLGWSNFVSAVSVPVLAAGETTTTTYQVRALRGQGAYAWQISAQTTAYEAFTTDDTAKLDGASIVSMLDTVWSGAVPVPSIAAPITADVNGDGAWDLLAGRLSATPGDPDLYAVDGNDGAVLWSAEVYGSLLLVRAATDATAFAYTPDTENLAAIDVTTGTVMWEYPMGNTFASFLASDVDADGRTELMIAQSDGMALLNITDGNLAKMWPFPSTVNSFASSPVLADFTHEGLPDVVVSSLEGGVFAFANTDASVPALAWQKIFDAPVVGGALLADLDGDTELEAVVGDLAGGLHVLAADSGASLFAVTVPVERLWMAPALLHRGLGAPGLLISGSSSRPDGWTTSLLAYDAAGGLLWQVDRPGVPGPAITIDVNHDGYDEVLWLVGDRSPAVYPLNLAGLTGARSRLYVVGNDGTIHTVFEFAGAIWSPPLAGDLDDDGWLDLVVVGAGPGGALLRLSTPWPWPAGSGWVGAPGTTYPSGF